MHLFFLLLILLIKRKRLYFSLFSSVYKLIAWSCTTHIKIFCRVCVRRHRAAENEWKHEIWRADVSTLWLLSHRHLSSSNCIQMLQLAGVSTKQAQPRPLHKWNTINVFIVSELQTLQKIPLPTTFWVMLYVLFASNYSEILLY